MRHFFRTQLTPVEVLRIADDFFPEIGMERTGHTARSRMFGGDLGKLQLSVRKEGGHYTFVEIVTDYLEIAFLRGGAGEAILELHKAGDPRHRIEAAY